MKKISRKPMFIYISGPYSPPADETDPTKRENSIEENIRKANEAALLIAKKGHVPFVPHTMMKGWEDFDKVPRERAMQICHNWIEKCDAMYIIAPSAGAESERQLAVRRNLRIYRDIDDIPEASLDSSSSLSPEAIKCYLTEYHECMESYRHTYATIWQSGAVITAIYVAIVAFANISEIGRGSLGIPPLIQVLAPVPFLFWWWGIFRPMNRYGELRSDRLVKIEQLLNESVPELQMCHFISYGTRKEKGAIGRFLKFEWLIRPRVSEVVSIFGITLLLLEIYLLWVHYLFPWLMLMK